MDGEPEVTRSTHRQLVGEVVRRYLVLVPFVSLAYFVVLFGVFDNDLDIEIVAKSVFFGFGMSAFYVWLSRRDPEP